MAKRLPIFIILLAAARSLLAQEIPVDSLKNLSARTKLNFSRDTVFFDEIAEPPEQNTIGTLSSTEVGQTSGKLSVSPTGGATYTVPIAVPPGINGVEPEIALVYNSQGGNGLVGWGWNISGISVITRIPSTKFHDDNINEVNFDATDRFALDGQRLLLKSGTYGAAGAQYETENYSNIKTTSHGTSPYGGVYGPAYFKVTYPDGSFAYYGNSSNSRSRTDYAITYWQNPQGLRVSYTYALSGNSLSISSIKYGSRTTTTPVNEIQFIYTTRARPEQAYVGGIGFRRTNILSQIKVIGNGTGYRNYNLAYNETSLGYQRLINIQEKSGDNTRSYDPILFTYTDTPDGVVVAPVTDNISIGNVGQDNARVVSGDFTGNGKMDFIVYPTYGPDTKKKFWLFTDLHDDGDPDFTFGYPYNTGLFEEIFPVTYLSGRNTIPNKLPSRQGLVLIQEKRNKRCEF